MKPGQRHVAFDEELAQNKPEYALGGVRMKQHLSSKDTAGVLSLFENRSDKPSTTPIHLHIREAETLYVLEGEIQAILAGVEHTLHAGEAIFLPRAVPHQLRNESGAPAHYLLLCTPGGFEAFLSEVGQTLSPGETPHPPSATDLDRLRAAAPRYGITLFRDWPADKSELKESL